jgi:hypothetical protein
VGNKHDLVMLNPKDRAVSIEEATALAESENMDFLETSALAGHCVERMFRRLILSAARLLPDIATHLDLAALPEGWMIYLPPDSDEPPASRSTTTTTSSISSSSPSRSRGSIRRIDISSASESNIDKSAFDDFDTDRTSSSSCTTSSSSSTAYRRNHRIVSTSSAASMITMNNLHTNAISSLQKGAKDDTGLADFRHYATPRVLYMNYWTTETQEQVPEAPANPGLLYIAGTVLKKTEKVSDDDLKQRQSLE